MSIYLYSKYKTQKQVQEITEEFWKSTDLELRYLLLTWWRFYSPPPPPLSTEEENRFSNKHCRGDIINVLLTEWVMTKIREKALPGGMSKNVDFQLVDSQIHFPVMSTLQI